MSDITVERRHQVFRKLNDEQLKRIARYGEQHHVPAGEILYEQGTSALGIHVVLGGAVEIVRPGIQGDELITIQRAGEFTGEVNVISGRGALVRARMVEDGDVLVIRPEGLRQLIQKDSEISEVLMRAFLLRRVVLVAGGLGDAMLIGSAHSAGTLRLRGFLTDLSAEDLSSARWPLARAPFLFETNRHRVFAVGDVRAGNVKRIAAAVGEGSVCVELVHRALAE